MCGIVAVVGKHGQQVPLSAVESAADTLAHRGPDDCGTYSCGNVAFGFRRLSIIEPGAGGHQPMTSDDGELTIIFNGEIYNYVELREELRLLGHTFRSSSDTEVLLAAYRQWGPECVGRFNGMWAFIIHDRRLQVMFGSRDRLGVKPLYLWHDRDWLVLASEPRAVAASGLTNLKPDWSRFADSLVWGQMDHGNGTCLSGIRHIPAGCRFWVDRTGRLATERFWSVPRPDPAAPAQPSEAWIDELRHLVRDAVAIRQRSDVPVGFTLSGGIDSTLLICEAAHLERSGPPLLAFAYQDERFDESRQIADTLGQTGAQLMAVRGCELDLRHTLPELIVANGEPVHSVAAAANYTLFGLARRHGVKVVIGGQGADEVFAGYGSYERDYWHSLLCDLRIGAFVSDIRASSRRHGRSAAIAMSTTIARTLRIGLAQTRAYRWLRSRSRFALPPRRALESFNPELLAKASRPTFRAADFRLSGSQRQSLMRWPLPMYLRIEDRCSMAHGVEARLPFTDYRLVEHAMRMPDDLKFSHGLNKVALRRAANGRVPASVTARADKFGFPVSAGGRTATGLHEICADLVSSRPFAERGIYNVGRARQLLDARNPEQACAQTVEAWFQLAQTELWLRDLAATNTARVK